MDIAHGVRFPLLGPVITSGTAQLPGPFSYWLAAFPQLFTRAPEAGNVFFELLGAAAVWMFWYALRRPFGDAAATFAAALLAFSPWSAAVRRPRLEPERVPGLRRGWRCSRCVRLRERPDSAWAAVLPVAVPGAAAPAQLGAGRLARAACRSAAGLSAAGTGASWRSASCWRRCSTSRSRSTRRKTGIGNTRAFIAETLGGQPRRRRGPSLVFPAEPDLCPALPDAGRDLSRAVRLLGRPERGAAWHALWHGSPARPFHPLRLLALLASGVLLLLAAVVHHPRGARRTCAGPRRRAAPGAVDERWPRIAAPVRARGAGRRRRRRRRCSRSPASRCSPTT